MQSVYRKLCMRWGGGGEEAKLQHDNTQTTE